MAAPVKRRKLKWTEFVHHNMKDHEMFIVCLPRTVTNGQVPDEELDALVHTCKQTHGITTLMHSTSYAGSTIEMRWRERARAYTVMDFLLHAGVALFTQTRMCVNVGPGDLKPGDSCTPEWLERVTVGHMRAKTDEATSMFKGDVARAINMYYELNPVVYGHEASWLTQEGRGFVQWLSGRRRHTAESSDEEVRVEEALAAPIEQGHVADECMICLVNPPNTLVLPCMDRVVCSACSPMLKKTPDAHICVQCRRSITDVLEDNVTK